MIAIRNFLLLGLLTVLVSAGCSGNAATDSNQNSNTPVQAQQYEDANVALADGTNFLDTGETDLAINALSQAVKINPELGEAWFKLGIAYALAEKCDQTLEITTAENSSTDSKKPAKTNSEKAFEKAVAAYKKSIAQNDQDHAAYYNLGRAYNKLNEDEDAAKALKQAVKLMADDTEYQTELGAILIKLAQYQEAIPPLKKALELDPENIRAQELLEDAEAGRSRVNYASTPKEEKKSSNSNSNTTSNSSPTTDKLPPPPPSPAPKTPQPRPSATKPS